MKDLFIKAIKKGFRFPSKSGLITTEDLYSLPLTSKNRSSLEDTARTLYNSIKESEEVSFVEPASGNSELSEKLDIVKFVIADKQSDNKEKQEAIEKSQEKARLKELLASKRMEKDSELSIEELEQRINSL